MLNYYQPFLKPFLKSIPNPAPVNLRQYYFHSFEDALWALLENLFPDQRVTILVPDFYCSDVLDNIKRHGHNYIYYPLDENLQINSSNFKKYLWLYRPEVVIIFHPAGITANLTRDKSWLNDLPANSIIVEDCVHRLVDPAELRFFTSRHFIIDSLRKVTPLPGSRMFSSTRAPLIQVDPGSKIDGYLLFTLLSFIVFRLVLQVGFLLNSSGIVAFAHQKILRFHDDLIGDDYHPRLGLNSFKSQLDYLDYESFAKIKESQVIIYRSLLKPILKTRVIYPLKIPRADHSRLHVFPLGFRAAPSPELEKYLQAHNFPIWFKFTDTPWSQSRSVLFLPLGFHVSETDINNFCRCLIEFFHSPRQL